VTTVTRTLRIGTRASRLARWQTAQVGRQLENRAGARCEEVTISTAGDRDVSRPLPEIGGEGLFTEALAAALRRGDIDLAVHSLKDLPIASPADLIVAAVCQRADARDVLIARDHRTLDALPRGAIVGTSSRRRSAQLRAARPDLVMRPLRGNVDTRVRRALDGDFDAIVLAAAGVERLGLNDAISSYLPYDLMLPAPGQGALAVQCRADDEETLQLLARLDDPEARATTAAERTFLEALGGGCSAPVGAVAEILPESGRTLWLRGFVGSEDGSRALRVSGEGRSPEELGRELADAALSRGARELLA
jgi:hydroxymethylbilane synthase